MFGKKKNALEPPPISKDADAREILRVWAGPNLPQQFSLDLTWEDPAAWGLLLVDLGRHAAKAYAANGRLSEAEAFARIKAGLDAEWNNPTDAH